MCARTIIELELGGLRCERQWLLFVRPKYRQQRLQRGISSPSCKSGTRRCGGRVERDLGFEDALFFDELPPVGSAWRDEMRCVLVRLTRSMQTRDFIAEQLCIAVVLSMPHAERMPLFPPYAVLQLKDHPCADEPGRAVHIVGSRQMCQQCRIKLSQTMSGADSVIFRCAALRRKDTACADKCGHVIHVAGSCQTCQQLMQ